jgi:hypothetical protein
VTLQCVSPAELRVKSWDVLEVWCQRTVTAPQPALAGSTANTTAISTANTTAVSTSQPDQFNTTAQPNVSVTGPSTDDSPSPPARLLISVSLFAVAVYCVVVALTVTTRKLRVTFGNDSDRAQRLGPAEYSALRPDSSAVQFRATEHTYEEVA